MLHRTLRSAISRHPASRRLLHPAPALLAEKPPAGAPPSSSHTADSYFKDVDASPPPDAKIHRVDPSSDTAQKPHEPPSGAWSRAGTQTKEYQSVSADAPYDAPADGGALRYGGKERYPEEKGGETSHSGQGPEGAERGGRKPEGR